MTEKPRQRRHQKNKQAILDQALKLISKKGHQNVSLREIARHADYSPAGLYEYFASKDEILEALRERVNTQMVQELDIMDKKPNAREHLIDLGLAYVNFAVENMECFQLLDKLPSRRKSLEEPVVSGSPYLVFQKAVEALIGKEKIETTSTYGIEEITYSVWTMVHGMATLRQGLLFGFQANFEVVNRIALQIFIDGLKVRLEGKH